MSRLDPGAHISSWCDVSLAFLVLAEHRCETKEVSSPGCKTADFPEYAGLTSKMGFPRQHVAVAAAAQAVSASVSTCLDSFKLDAADEAASPDASEEAAGKDGKCVVRGCRMDWWNRGVGSVSVVNLRHGAQ